MTHTEHLLTILAEECAEVAQRVSKALRFGLEERQPGQTLTNADRIRGEMFDLLTVYMMLHQEGSLPNIGVLTDGEAIREKKEKVEKFLRYSIDCGTLSEETKYPFGICDACGSPRKADGCCSRSQCYNSD